MPRQPTDREPVAHPYARISDPAQRQGGGLVRQTADPQTVARVGEFCRTKRVLVDDGVSAFRGLNATPNHELGRFLADARRGTVRKGDCLLLENYDRLSRQDPWAAIGLVNDLRQLGVHVGRLDRMKLLRCDSTDYGDFFEAAVEFMRGNSESAAKSARNGSMWERKREAARGGLPQPATVRMGEGCRAITRRLPAWVRERGGRLELVPERALVVRRIFALIAAGYGYNRVVKRFTEEGVPAFGENAIRPGRKRSAHSGRWTRPYLARIVTDRRATGEYQPRDKGGSPEGPPIPNYFPACVSEAEYWAARSRVAAREQKARDGGAFTRIGKHVNLFSGLLREARGGGSYIAARNTARTYATLASTHGAGKPWSFPLEVLDRAILRFLSEIDPHEVLNGDTRDDSIALAGELAGVEGKIGEVEAEMMEGDVPALARVMRALEARRKELAEKLAEARQKAAHPLSETWGEAQSLLGALDGSPDPEDTRLRLRSALRRMVDSVWLLVVPRGRDRLAAVQIWFAGGKRHRDYLVLHRAAGYRRPGGAWAGSAADGPGDADLRQRARVAGAERFFATIDVEGLKAKLAPLEARRMAASGRGES
jgi:DNA invertase Pin-like site-specific DNA recombinase